MIEYLNGNYDFKLFKRRKERRLKENYTLFECLKEDFISRTQQDCLEKFQLSHQNAWDEETLIKDFNKSGFVKDNIFVSKFKESKCPFFYFEATEDSEANEDYRSLYVEGKK